MTYPNHNVIRAYIDTIGGIHQFCDAHDVNIRNAERFYSGSKPPPKGLIEDIIDDAETRAYQLTSLAKTLKSGNIYHG